MLPKGAHRWREAAWRVKAASFVAPPAMFSPSRDGGIAGLVTATDQNAPKVNSQEGQHQLKASFSLYKTQFCKAKRFVRGADHRKNRLPQRCSRRCERVERKDHPSSYGGAAWGFRLQVERGRPKDAMDFTHEPRLSNAGARGSGGAEAHPAVCVRPAREPAEPTTHPAGGMPAPPPQ